MRNHNYLKESACSDRDLARRSISELKIWVSSPAIGAEATASRVQKDQRQRRSEQCTRARTCSDNFTRDASS